MTADRDHHLVLFGATGFTGALTAEYLARNAPPECRWALAGRSPSKLTALRDRLAEINPACAELPLLHADSTDEQSLHEIASSTSVVITTVGPYINYGEPLVKACADAGTDYVDLCGEPEFADLMYVRHHRRAAETGARLIHACGFDSIPYDLGVHFTVAALPEKVPLTVDGIIRTGASFSGGTYHSAITAFSRARSMLEVAKQRRKNEPRPKDRQVHLPMGSIRRDRETGRWLVPMPTIDPQIVGRSAAALSRYGPHFTYRHQVAIKRLPLAVGGVAGAGLLFAMAQIPPARRWLLDRKKPGEGPSAEQRAKAWFKVTFRGEGGGRKVVTEVSGGDPGYDETAKMLSESALCLAFDNLPAPGGQSTTAAVMGEPLTKRLINAGLKFEVVSQS